MKLATYKGVKEVIKKHDIVFKKRFGQNFLIDNHVLNKIISASSIDKNDIVIEIGPGIGSLTEELLEKAHKVIAIEIDKTLIPILEENLSTYNNLEIINDDILKVDIDKIITNNSDKNIKIVANLPYYITTPIIMGLLEKNLNIQNITVMIQKEVANRMKAMPNSKDYGSLSLAIRYYASPYLVANVPSNCFIPRPNVDSAVIKLDILKEPYVKPLDANFMFKVIKSAFSKRRKTLVNCLFADAFLNLTKADLETILQSLEFDKSIRGEKLVLLDFAKLSDKLILYRND